MSLRLNDKSLRRIEELAGEVCQREGCFLYDVEFVGGSSGKGKKLRVFVDKDSENGVSIDECANVSRGLSLLLDVEDEVVPEGSYDLEVSSPGLERKLRLPWHFEKAVGKQVSLRVTRPFSEFNEYPQLKNRMAAQGTITTVEGESLKLKVDQMELSIPFDFIQKANVIFEFSTGKKTKN